MRLYLPFLILFSSLILSACQSDPKWKPGLPKVKTGSTKSSETTVAYLEALYNPNTPPKVFLERAKALGDEGGFFLPNERPELLMNSATGSPNSPSPKGDEYVYSPKLGSLKKHTENIKKEIIVNLNQKESTAIEEVKIMLELAMGYTAIGNPQSYVQGEYIVASILKVLEGYPEVISSEGIRGVLKTTKELEANQIKARMNEYQTLLTYMFRDYKSGNDSCKLDWDLCARGLDIIRENHPLTAEQKEWNKLINLAQQKNDTKTMKFLSGPIVETILALNPEETGTLTLQKDILNLVNAQ